MTTSPGKVALALLVGLLVLFALAPAQGRAAVRGYNLGDVELPDASPKGPLPVRLWGVVGVPEGRGPFPLVVVAHGRHGDNCPHTQSFVFTWPCFNREQRNDQGMRHIVKALTERGVAAIAPDLNGAYTIGWPEGDDPRSGNEDQRRWPRIVNRTLSELATEDRLGGGEFGVPLEGRVDLGQIGLLGHSRSGLHVVRLARSRFNHTSPEEISAGQGRIDSLFLLAPIFDGVRLPDLETAVVLSECDGDVLGQGRHYLERAVHQPGRRDPVLQVRLARANHNYYNSTLSDLGIDDGSHSGGHDCSASERLLPASQQRWIDSVVSSYFATTLRGASPPPWMRPARAPITRLYGLAVMVKQLFPLID